MSERLGVTVQQFLDVVSVAEFAGWLALYELRGVEAEAARREAEVRSRMSSRAGHGGL